MTAGSDGRGASTGREDIPSLADIPGLTRGIPAPGTSTRPPAAAGRAAGGRRGAQALPPPRPDLPDAASAAPPDAASGGAHGNPPSGPPRGEVQAALGFLLKSTNQRPQTEAELRAKLAKREVDDDVAEAALAEAKRLRAVDDAAFARAWVDDRGRKRGYGASRLRTELRRRLVPEGLVDDALRLLDDRDDLAVATDLAARRAASLPGSLAPENVARRLMAYLVRRGYPPGLAQRAAISASGLDRVWD